MSLDAQKILAADMLLDHLGISVIEYVAAKQAATMKEEPEKVHGSPFLSRQEAADLLRCSVDTVDNIIAAGKIKSSKLSSARCGRVLIDRGSVISFVHRCATVAGGRNGRH